MTCRCPASWPVLHATWRAQHWTIRRLHNPAACGLPADLVDLKTWRTR